MGPQGYYLNRQAMQAARLRAGLRVVDLAQRAGCSHATVSNAERGARAVSPRMAARFAELLGVSVEQLTAATPAPADEQAGAGHYPAPATPPTGGTRNDA
jgi:transcriptional regulator with XRE-family HTH domain